MSNQITLPVIVAGISSKVDGSIKIVLETRELPPQQAADLFALRNRESWAVLAPDEIKEAKIPDEKPDSATGQKTPSQRLRNVLCVYWTQHGKQGDFESYYRVQIEKVIEQLKEKLEDK